MTTATIILLIASLLCLFVFIIDQIINNDSSNRGCTIFIGIWLSLTFIVLGGSITLDLSKPTDIYQPKTKVTITSDSTYHIDTLYYIKIKPKTK